MTKKHFIELARGLIALRENALADVTTPQMRSGRLTQWLNTRNALADFCKSQNPRFDRERWLDYIAGKCGPSGGKVKVAA